MILGIFEQVLHKLTYIEIIGNKIVDFSYFAIGYLALEILATLKTFDCLTPNLGR